MKLNELLSTSAIKDVETFADTLWHKLGIDVKFSNHFLERVNDSRNGKDISAAELIALFKKEYQKFGKEISKLPSGHEAVLKDLLTKLNAPVVLNSKSNNKVMVAKTVMRKDSFKTSSPEYKV